MAGNITDKFGLHKIIEDVKSIISPVNIPEASKDDPVGYYMSELAKIDHELAASNAQQADILARANHVLGALHQALAEHKNLTKPDNSPPAAGSETSTSLQSQIPDPKEGKS